MGHGPGGTDGFTFSSSTGPASGKVHLAPLNGSSDNHSPRTIIQPIYSGRGWFRDWFFGDWNGRLVDGSDRLAVCIAIRPAIDCRGPKQHLCVCGKPHGQRHYGIYVGIGRHANSAEQFAIFDGFGSQCNVARFDGQVFICGEFRRLAGHAGLQFRLDGGRQAGLCNICGNWN